MGAQQRASEIIRSETEADTLKAALAALQEQYDTLQVDYEAVAEEVLVQQEANTTHGAESMAEVHQQEVSVLKAQLDKLEVANADLEGVLKEQHEAYEQLQKDAKVLEADAVDAHEEIKRLKALLQERPPGQDQEVVVEYQDEVVVEEEVLVEEEVVMEEEVVVVEEQRLVASLQSQATNSNPQHSPESTHLALSLAKPKPKLRPLSLIHTQVADLEQQLSASIEEASCTKVSFETQVADLEQQLSASIEEDSCTTVSFETQEADLEQQLSASIEEASCSFETQVADLEQQLSDLQQQLSASIEEASCSKVSLQVKSLEFDAAQAELVETLGELDALRRSIDDRLIVEAPSMEDNTTLVEKLRLGSADDINEELWSVYGAWPNKAESQVIDSKETWPLPFAGRLTALFTSVTSLWVSVGWSLADVQALSTVLFDGSNPDRREGCCMEQAT